MTQLPDDVLQRLLAGVPLDDHRAAASACKSFRDVIRGPRFLALRRRYGSVHKSDCRDAPFRRAPDSLVDKFTHRYGLEEYGIVEVASVSYTDDEIRMASNGRVVGRIYGCCINTVNRSGDCSTTDGARMFVSSRNQIWAVDAYSCTCKHGYLSIRPFARHVDR